MLIWIVSWRAHQPLGRPEPWMADGSAEYVKKLGLEVDLSPRGMGVRSNRYSMLVKDGIVQQLNVEQPGKFEVSNYETILGQAKAA